MIDITAIVLTKNEEKNIIDCLESLREFSEIIVIDDYSSDRTESVVKSTGFKNIKFIKKYLDNDFANQRNHALSLAKNEWVFFVDADERVSDRLLSEISDSMINTAYSGFFVKRVDVMLKKKLRHGETGSIKLLKLAKKKSGKWVGKVHEIWKVNGRTSELKSELDHYPHQSLSEFMREIDFYSTLRAKELMTSRVKISVVDIIFYPLGKFLFNFLLKLGFLDGLPGFVESAMMSFYSYLVRAKVWRKSRL